MTCRTLLRELRLLVGVELTPTNHPEKWISAIGGFLGILAVLWISVQAVGAQSAAMVVASIGASAVLLFAVPHGQLSQPWPFLGGTCSRRSSV